MTKGFWKWFMHFSSESSVEHFPESETHVKEGKRRNRPGGNGRASEEQQTSDQR
jgi:hypothetical protein